MKKYIVYPGYVTSKNDKERHYISAGQLMHLYGVHISECLIIRNEKDNYKLKGIKRNLISLFPRSDGKYKLYNQPIQATTNPTACIGKSDKQVG